MESKYETTTYKRTRGKISKTYYGDSEMRELKFRVWSKDYCDYYELEDFCGVDNRYFLEDTIVEQYTGLKDKNGREIYEGDIVRWCGGFYEIYFDIVQGWRGIDRRGIIPNGHTLYQMTINNVDKPNIVGNIHENKELLK